MSKSRTRRKSRDPQFEALAKEVVELRAKVAQNEAASAVTAKIAAAKKLTRRPRLAFAEFVPPVEEETPTPAPLTHYQTTATAKLTKSVDAFRLNEDPAARLAFEVDPHDAIAQSVYVPKTRGVSDQVLRRIGIQESLVACILHARGHQMAAHGNPRRDRFSFGYTIQLTPAAQAELSTEEKEDLQPEIQRAIKVLATCGRDDVPRKNRCTLGRWLYESTRDGLLLGRFATEVVYQPDAVDGKPKFEYFRPIDAATIYRVAPQGTEAARQVRVQSKQLLQRIDDEALPDENFLERFFDDEFAWVQVINGQPMQAFTEDQCLVHAFYPVTDVEAQGYPLTPIDTAISEVTTRLAITTHNRLYFQSGRASRGALVITSEDIDDTILQDMRQKFSASINGVSNCLDGRTTIWTQDGAVSLEQYLGDLPERLVKLWTPYGWQPGLVYRSGRKKLTETTLSNGTVMRMSPDHRVMSVDQNGDMEWRRQEDLSVGDCVFVNDGSTVDPTVVSQNRCALETVERVVSKVDTQTEVGMFDVAVYEPTHGCTGLDCKAKEHAFFADGVHSANSHRLPIFALAPGESAQWVSMDGPKDMEFQYLSDQNARTLLSVFQMSPEELPGYSHLSRGTATQALAECLSPESEVVTSEGTRKLGEIVGDQSEEFFKIWTGRCWSEARVFRSGAKLLRTTKLRNGSSIDTSPDHRFMRVGEDGQQHWVHQEELSVGDWVLVESDERWKTFASFLRLWYRFEIPEWFNYFHPEQVSELVEHPHSIEMVDVEVFDEHHGFVSAGFYLHNSNQEYLLEAHRDLGIRPLIEHFQGFLTNEILPLIAPSLVKHCEVRLLGLGAESAEKESVRIQQDLPVHLTFNEVMGRVEKEPVPRAVAGDVPLNPQWGALCDKMVPLNEQQAVFLAKDQEEAKRYRAALGTRYLRDPFWWQMRQDLWQQFQMLTTQALPLAPHALPGVIAELFPSVPQNALAQVAQELVAQAEQMMQQQAAQAGAGPDGGGGGGDPGGGQPPQDGGGDEQQGGGDPQGDPQAQPQDGGLGQDLQNAQDSLGKSERQLGRAERRALDAHKRAVSSTLSNFRREARMATMQIIGEVNKRRTGGSN